MMRFRPILPILATVLCGGVVHAGEFSLGSARLLAQNTPPDVVTFTERGHALRDAPAEGGDSAPKAAANPRLRGADVAPASPEQHPAADPHAKPSTNRDADAATADDSNHSASSVSPAAVIRRPSYRWQSLVPGTIK